MVRILLVPALTPLYLYVSMLASFQNNIMFERKSQYKPWGRKKFICFIYIYIYILSSVSPLCRVSTLIFLRQTMSLANIVLQLFWCNYSWCSYR